MQPSSPANMVLHVGWNHPLYSVVTINPSILMYNLSGQKFWEDHFEDLSPECLNVIMCLIIHDSLTSVAYLLLLS